MDQTLTLLGKGLYSPSGAARLLKMKQGARAIRRWASGYTYLYRGQQRHSSSVVNADFHGTELEGTLTFLDLMDLRIVAAFRSKGVSMPVIRAAFEWATRVLTGPHPFALRRFETDGKRIFAELQDKGDRPEGMAEARWMEELAAGQVVFPEIVESSFLDLDWEDEYARRFWPLGKDKRVVLDPARRFGRPIDHETGIRTAVLYAASQSGDPYEEIARWYDIPVDAIDRAAEYERLLRAA